MALFAVLSVFASLARAAPCNIILVPGAFGHGASSRFLNEKDYFSEYESFFKEKGCQVVHIEFPENATIESRALTLGEETKRFLQRVGGKSVVFIAHSQGGLDARFAIESVRIEQVSALITVGTPHRGTPLADWVIHTRESETVLYWLLKYLGRYDLKDLPFVGEMTANFLKKFEDKFKMNPSVRYASSVSACHRDCHWAFKLLDDLSGVHVMASEGDMQGDGIIPASSQSFGDDLGTYDLDHISEVGVDLEKHAERLRLLESLWKWINSLPA